MKTLARIVRVALFTAIATVGVASAKPSKIDFSEFEGNYQGLWLVSAGTVALPASVKAQVRPSKTGSDLTIDLTGIVSSGTVTVPILVTYKFKGKNRKVTASSPVLGLAGPAATLPSKFGGSKGTLRFTTTAAPGATLLGLDISNSSVSITAKFSKRKLTIFGIGTLIQNGSPQAVQFTVTLQKKKK